MTTDTQHPSPARSGGPARHVTLGIFLVALVPRLWALNAYITWDEPMWVFRSVHFLSAILGGALRDTFLVGHPGVITMICGAIGIGVQRFVLQQGAADYQWLVQLPALDPGDAVALDKLATFLLAAKVPLVLLQAACVAAIYGLVRRLFGRRAALVAGLLLATDPFHLALSRVLHIDGAAANLMMLSVLLLLISLERGWQRRMVLSGALAGLAVLVKSYALFLGPFTALVLFSWAVLRRRSLRQVASSFAVWCFGAALGFALPWPAMWADPVGTVRGMLGTALGYAAVPSEGAAFFLGQTVEDAGPSFYPLALAFRTTPLVWLGLVALLVVAVWLLFRPAEAPEEGTGAIGSRAFEVVVLIVYGLLFIAAMTFATKKFDRYMLPVIVALDILAAVGLATLTQMVRARAVQALVAAALLAQGAFVLWHHPYYLAYYNPLLGGTRVAPRVMPLGWGDGMNLAADYLNQKPGAEKLIVATGGMPGFAPLFDGQVQAFSELGLATSDYAVLYVSDVQQQSAAALRLANSKPEAVLQVLGMDYVWIYPNLEHGQLATYLRERVQPDDAVLVDALSPLTAEYPDIYALASGQKDVEVTTALMNIAAHHTKLWYVAYPDSDPQGWIHFQLGTHALLLNEEPFAHATVSRYQLPPPAEFVSMPVQGDLNTDFDRQLRLLRYELADGTIEYGKGLGVTLHWQSQLQLTQNYAVSLRLVDAQGHSWAQEDAWLVNDAGLGTSAWATGERSAARDVIRVPAGIPPGPYTLEVSAYAAESLARLAVLDPSGVAVGTEQAVATIMVQPASLAPTAEDVSIPQRVSHAFAGDLQLIGYGLSEEVVRPGDALPLSLFWQAQRAMSQDYQLVLELQDDKEKAWWTRTFALPNESYPTSLWRRGEIIHTRLDWLIDAAVPSGRYQLAVNLLDSAGQKVIDGGVAVAGVNVEGREHVYGRPQFGYAIRAELGLNVTLVGYDVEPVRVSRGGTLRLTLHWRARGRIDKSYTVFTHLLLSGYQVWGQGDSLPCGGDCPTTSWLPGEYISDTYEITVDADAPAGDYSLGVGMYDAKTMERLPALDERGRRYADDRVILSTPVTVE